MTIQEMVQKGKNMAKSALSGDFFIALIVVLVGLASFGLGRLSMKPPKEPVKIYQKSQEAAVVRSLPEAAIAEKKDSLPQGATTLRTGGGRYVASKNGSAYYLESCSGAKRIKDENKIWFSSSAAAESAGYHKAANCPGL